MTEDNQNNEFKPQPLPGQVFIRPGIDDRPDYEKTLTPEAKAAMRRCRCSSIRVFRKRPTSVRKPRPRASHRKVERP